MFPNSAHREIIDLLQQRASENDVLIVPKTADNVTGTSARVSRAEWVLLLLLLLLGFSLRLWQISSVGLDHLDEGVYVLSALGVSDPGQPYRLYPTQFRFSPPAYFALVALCYQALGAPSDFAAVLVNVFLGTLTIAAVWWVGRAWFGPQAGIAAAALVTLSEYHIALSRTALTDVGFVLFFFVALGLIAVALQRASTGLAVLAGIAVGISWNTKYHGWFALVIAGLALLPYAYIYRARGLALARLLFLFLVISGVAVICYLPWALFVQGQPGGYAALLQYERTLIDGHWRTNLILQAQNQLFSEGPLTRVSIAVAFLCATLVSPRRIGSGPRFLLALVFVCLAALLLGGAGTAALVSLLALPALFKRASSLSTWLALSGLAVWFFTTPLYHPYARLVLPFTITTYLIAGFWIAVVLNGPSGQVVRSIRQPIWAAIGIVIVLVAAFLLPRAGDPWRSSRSVPEAAAAMSVQIPPGSRIIVLGEPEVAFYLHLRNRPTWENTPDPDSWESNQTPVFIVTGVYVKRSLDLREELEKLGPRLVPLGKYAMEPKDIRLLDDFTPQEARAYRAQPDDTFELTLYRLAAKSQTP